MKKPDLCVLKFSGLNEGTHKFEYKIDKKLFENFESSEIHDAELTVNVKLHKRKTMLELKFDITGNINVTCDICLENFNMSISYQTELFAEFGQENSDLSDADNNITLSYNESQIILDKHIFDYVNICLPYKKVHPDDENGNPTCNPEMIKRIEELSVKNPENEQTESPWDKLKNLYN